MKSAEKSLLMLFATLLINMSLTASLFAGSMVAYWTFDEGGGDVLNDLSGTGNDGQISGDPKWVAGRMGKAIEFDGKDDFVLVKNHESYNFTKEDSFSISLWINYEPKGDWAGAMQKFNGGYPFKVEVEPDNDLYFAVYDGTNFPKAFIGNVSGEWHHCCFMRDAKKKKLYAFLDGVLKEESDDITTGEIANSADLYIGARKPGNTITYKGMLDEIAIYNRLLTEDEIKQAANGKTPETVVERSGKLAITWGSLKL